VGFERRAEAEHGRERLAQVVRHQGEELVLVGLEIAGRRHIPHDALEPDDLSLAMPGGRADLEHAPHAVGPEDDELESPRPARRLGEERTDRAVPVHG
jgi:hypothetical protein